MIIPQAANITFTITARLGECSERLAIRSRLKIPSRPYNRQAIMDRNRARLRIRFIHNSSYYRIANLCGFMHEPTQKRIPCVEKERWNYEEESRSDRWGPFVGCRVISCAETQLI